MTLDLNQNYQAITSAWDIAELDLKTLLSFSDKTVLYFYPKDNTPGCTIENKDFSSLREEFNKLGVTLIGVSKDSIESHKKFIEKQELTIDLISDPELILHKALGAYGEKNNYGKIVQGVIRSTFLLNKQGEILEEWRNIRAKGHAERILKAVS
jgi:peroxiredoxin Q/BCP